MREFREDAGRGGSDDERVGGLRGVDVFDCGGEISFGIFGGIGPQAGDDFVSGERGEGERLDELFRRFGHDDVNIERVLLQGAHQLRCFVSGDSAGDADCDLHTRHFTGRS